MIFTVYNTTTGMVIKKINAVDSVVAGWQVESGQSIIQQDLNSETQYLVSSTPTTRPLLSSIATWDSTTLTADNIDTVILSGLPNPSNYSIQTPLGVSPITSGTITDGTLEFKTDFTGTYTIVIDSFPYQLYSQNITAV